MDKLNFSDVVKCVFLAAALATCAGRAVPQAKSGENASLSLDKGWEFRQVTPGAPDDNGDWLPATVPGDVHLDLLANKKIPDPFYRDDEAKLQWIENASWEYRLNFDVTQEFLARSNIDMVFDGIDAAAQVFVNGAPVLEANNMFRIWRIPVKTHLHAGGNQLRVVFPSPIKAAEQVASGDPFRLQSKAADKTYIRKAAYEYGWDWGPRFVTSGIWRPVRLEAWDKARIADFAIRQRDVSRDVAHLTAEVDIEASIEGAVKLSLNCRDNGTPIAIATTTHVHKGRNLVEIPIEIPHPRLWYPAGYGEQFLYSFTAEVSASNQIAAQSAVKTGLRSIELHRQLDQWGRSFEFIVNGIPVFAKGADVIPFDSFPSRVTTGDYRRILQSARDANMNMIRVWGGGYYGSEDFYSICDELGIMVWEDFMFGNDWQPGTYAFKLEIEAEAENQVRRLRNHPSIVIWCGNNETEMGLNWSPRDTLSLDVKFQMWQDYLTEFSGILPRVVARLEPEIPYWPSSPSADYEPLSDKFQSGDAHDWTVWHGRAPFSEYEKHHWRFVTEFGFQSFPEMRTVETFTEPQDRTGIFTPIMLAHQKNNEGNSLIQEYISRDYPQPKDFASFLYVSQVLQAEGVKIGAEHFRRSRPETMGSIFWQLNDCWPVASWSSIDYDGRWKALQYYARRFYAPILVSPHVEDGAVKVYVVSDRTEIKPATLRVRLIDFDGKVLLEETHAVNVAPLASQVLLTWPMTKLTDAATDAAQLFVVADLSADGTEISRNLSYLLPVKQVHLKPADLSVETIGENGIYRIGITSPVLARSVYLSFGSLDVRLSDNYFDLLPGDTVEIQATSASSLADLKAQLKVISLVDAFAPEVQPPAATAAR